MKNYSFVKVKSINKLQGAAYFDNSYALIDDDNLYIYETEAKQRERFEIYKNNLQNSMSNSKFSYLTETTNTPCYLETIQVNEQQGKHIIWQTKSKVTLHYWVALQVFSIIFKFLIINYR